MQERENPELIRLYLLGDLDEERQEKIEERLLSDEELQAELSDSQDELIDDYALGRLSDRERTLFETNFLLSPERLHKLRLARALVRYAEANVTKFPSMQASAPNTPRQRLFHFLQTRKLAVAISSTIILLTIGYIGWSVYQHKQLKDQLAKLRSQQLKVEQELARMNTGELSPQRASMVAVTLRPLLRDSGQVSRAVITEGTEILQLRLETDENRFTLYRAVIETDEGVGLYTINDVKAKTDNGRKVVVLNLPSRLLPAGSYQIHLSGITTQKQPEDIGKYPFQVSFK
jgi:hypothetical protein